MKRWAGIVPVVTICVVATFSACGTAGIVLSESAAIEYDGMQYQSGSTIDFGNLSTAEGLFYVDCGFVNLLVEKNILLTEITSTGDFETSYGGLPFDVLAGDTFGFGLTLLPVEAVSYGGTLTFTADGSRDTFVIHFVAEGFTPAS